MQRNPAADVNKDIFSQLKIDIAGQTLHLLDPLATTLFLTIEQKLKDNHSNENLDFLVALQKNPNNKNFDAIITQFISANAESQINIQDKDRNELLKKHKDGTLTLNDFSHAINEVFSTFIKNNIAIKITPDEEKQILANYHERAINEYIEKNGSAFRQRIELDSADLNLGRIIDTLNSQFRNAKVSGSHFVNQLASTVQIAESKEAKNGAVIDFIKNMVNHGVTNLSLQSAKEVYAKSNELNNIFISILKNAIKQINQNDLKEYSELTAKHPDLNKLIEEMQDISMSLNERAAKQIALEKLTKTYHIDDTQLKRK